MNQALLLLLALFGALAVASGQLENISEQCLYDLKALTSNQVLIARAVDAWGKPVGFFQGTFTSLGDSIACRSIEQHGFKYALVIGSLLLVDSIKVPSQLGICVPESCLYKDQVQPLFDIISDSINSQRPREEDYVVAEWKLQLPLVKQMAAIYKNAFEQPRDLVEYKVNQVRVMHQSAWDAGAIITLILLLILIVVVIVSTGYHRSAIGKLRLEKLKADLEQELTADNDGIDQSNQHEEETNELLPKSKSKVQHNPERTAINDNSPLFAFSLYKTLPALFHVEESKRHPELAVLNCIRVLSMMWVIYCHSISNFIQDTPVDVLDLVATVNSFVFAPLANGFFSVDSFFFMSIFLVSYFQFTSPEKSLKQFNYIKFVVLRYLRTTPTYLLVMLVWMFLVPLMGSGPVWYIRQDVNPEKCFKYWWSNLLYINNFVPSILGESCMGWTWYLAADFQLYMLVPVLSLPLLTRLGRKWSKLIFVLAVVIGISVMIPLSIVNDITTNLVPNENSSIATFQKNLRTWQTLFYTRPFFRLLLLIVSVFGAYILNGSRKKYLEMRDSGYGLSKPAAWSLVFCRIIGVAVLLIVLYLPYINYHGIFEWGKVGDTFYNVLSRGVWAFGLLMFIYPSVVYHEEVKDSILEIFLAWKGWTIMARLTYCVYMIHCIVFIVALGYNERALPFTWMSSFMTFGGGVLWSHFFSIGLFLIIEAPVGLLVKQLLAKAKK